MKEFPLDMKDKHSSEEYFGKMISDFVEHSSGLSLQKNKKTLTIKQTTDGKALCVCLKNVEDIIRRSDFDQYEFLQVNFVNGKKILLTENLIGFKPLTHHELDPNKLPKVVTTVDLIGVVEALEETVSSGRHLFTEDIETDILKKVFQSILNGGMDVGFDLSQEKHWPYQITNIRHKFIS